MIKLSAKFEKVVQNVMKYVNEGMNLNSAMDAGTHSWHAFDNLSYEKQCKLYDDVEDEVLKRIR
jgi:hypothetical protein